MFCAASARAGMIDESSLKPWENCALCHSLDGVSHMAKFPKLAGQGPACLRILPRQGQGGAIGCPEA